MFRPLLLVVVASGTAVEITGHAEPRRPRAVQQPGGNGPPLTLPVPPVHAQWEREKRRAKEVGYAYDGVYEPQRLAKPLVTKLAPPAEIANHAWPGHLTSKPLVMTPPAAHKPAPKRPAPHKPAPHKPRASAVRREPPSREPPALPRRVVATQVKPPVQMPHREVSKTRGRDQGPPPPLGHRDSWDDFEAMRALSRGELEAMQDVGYKQPAQGGGRPPLNPRDSWDDMKRDYGYNSEDEYPDWNPVGSRPFGVP